MGNVKLRSVFGICLIVAAASLTALAGCSPTPPGSGSDAAPAAQPDVAGASRHAGGVRPGDTNVTNLVATGDVEVGGDLTVSGECVGCSGGTTIETLADIPTLSASKPVTLTFATLGQLILNGGPFDEDVSALRIQTPEGASVLSVTGDGEVAIDSRLVVGADAFSVSKGGDVAVTGSLSVDGTPYIGKGSLVSQQNAFANLDGLVYTNELATSAITFTLAGAAPNRSVCFYVFAAQTLYVDPASGDQIHVLTNATGDRISSATPGDSICLVATDYTNWAAYAKSGAWADAN
jgi:hypothetical protein